MLTPGVRPLLLLAVLALACGGGDEKKTSAEKDSAGDQRGADKDPAGDADGGSKAAGETDGAVEDPISYPATDEGLRSLFGDLIASIKPGGDESRYQQLMRSLRLPDHERWFHEHFGRRLARRLIEEYEPITEEIGQMRAVLTAQLDKGLRSLEVESFRDPDDAGATGYQSKALAAMKDRVELYSVRLVDDSKEKSFHLWSFVHDGGTFRFVGKMKKVVHKAPSEQDGHDLLELRLADAKRLELSKELEELKADQDD